MDPSSYDFFDAFETGAAVTAGLLVFLLVFCGILLVLTLGMYVAQGIAMLRMAKKVGVPNGWMAFVPVANAYLIGRIADAGTGKGVHTKRLLISYIVMYVLLIPYEIATFVTNFLRSDAAMGVAFVFVGFALAYMAAAVCACVFCYIAYYHICKNFGGASGTGYFVGLLVSAFVCAPVVCVLLLILSGKTPAMTENGSTVVTPPTPPTPRQDDVFTA